MCGLYGVVAPKGLFNMNVESLYELALVSLLRGRHASGMIALNEIKDKKGKLKQVWHHHKSTENVVDFFKDPATQSLLPGTDRETMAVIGHTRWATLGSLTKANAHPHRYKHLLGVHNGTIKDFEPKDGKDVSDSRMLFRKMADEGLEKTLKAARWGAYAIVWVDFNDHNVHIIRNNERTLFYAQTHNATWWASERRFLSFARVGHAKDGIQEFKPYHHYVIDTDTGEMTETDLTTKIGKWAGAMWDKRQDTVFTPVKGTPLFPDETKPDKIQQDLVEDLRPLFNRGKEDQVIHEDSLTVLGDDRVRIVGFHGFNHTFLTLKEAEFLLDDGCMNCTVQSTVNDKVYWCDHETYICESCVDRDATMEDHIPDMSKPGHKTITVLEKAN